PFSRSPTTVLSETSSKSCPRSAKSCRTPNRPSAVNAKLLFFQRRSTDMTNWRLAGAGRNLINEVAQKKDRSAREASDGQRGRLSLRDATQHPSSATGTH